MFPEDTFSASHETVRSVMPKERLVNPIINLFDSIPPPDDCDDWDVNSDSPSEQDDYIPYHHADEKFNRSSIFDNEPPSLGPNEPNEIERNSSDSRQEIIIIVLCYWWFYLIKKKISKCLLLKWLLSILKILTVIQKLTVMKIRLNIFTLLLLPHLSLVLVVITESSSVFELFLQFFKTLNIFLEMIIRPHEG